MSKVVCKIYFAFYVFTNSSNCYSHILAGIYLMFLKNVLDQAWATIVMSSHILAGICIIFLKNIFPNLKIFQNRIWTSAKISEKELPSKTKIFCNVLKASLLTNLSGNRIWRGLERVKGEKLFIETITS